jgi:hypothetical protein
LPPAAGGAVGAIATGGNVLPEETTEEYEQLPRAEVLAKLYELRDQVESAIRKRGVHNPASESERHYVIHGHRLEHGCCRNRPASPASRRSEL